MLRFFLALVLLVSVGEASAATRCSPGLDCVTTQTRNDMRPGNGHYQAERRRYGLDTQKKQDCGSKPLVSKNMVLNEPACQR